MSETKHSPEPWRAEKSPGMTRTVITWHRKSPETEEDEWIAVMEGPPGNWRTEADARRIVACVNACAGIPTEALEAGRLVQVLDLAEIAAEEEGLGVLTGALRALGRL